MEDMTNNSKTNTPYLNLLPGVHCQKNTFYFTNQKSNKYLITTGNIKCRYLEQYKISLHVLIVKAKFCHRQKESKYTVI